MPPRTGLAARAFDLINGLDGSKVHGVNQYFCRATFRCVAMILVALVCCSLFLCGCGDNNIHHAAKSGDLEKVESLLKSNPALVSSKDTNGWTPLHWAARMGRSKKVAELLLAHGAEVNAKASGISDDRWPYSQPFFGKGNFEGLTPLHLAAGSGFKVMVKLLLDNNAVVDAKDNDGDTALDYAASAGFKDVAELLLIHKAAYNIFDVVAIGDLERVKALLKTNPDLASSKDALSMTPLHYAADRGLRDIMELLLASKADVNATNYWGFTPLHQAAMACRQSGVAELLLAHGAEVNATDKYGATPLHAAANNGNAVAAEALLANKAAVNAKDKHGWTALHYAISGGSKEVVQMLLAHGAGVNAKTNEGRTPMRDAVLYGNSNLAGLLRQHGGHE